MRTFNFTLLAAMLGYVAVIGAGPLGVRAPAESVDRRDPGDPPYCTEYPDGTGCSTACRVNPLQQRCRDLCDQDIHLSFCPGSPPHLCLNVIGGHCFDRRQFPYCDDHSDAPGCDGSNAPSCDDDPLQPSCVDICVKNPGLSTLSFCLSVLGQAAKPADRR